ncbi:MAG: hypothetical protein KGL73_12635, partial [Burkholderiales bacterium]|nr:hypothetical protein [Burkholderiales bacterium]
IQRCLRWRLAIHFIYLNIHLFEYIGFKEEIIQGLRVCQPKPGGWFLLCETVMVPVQHGSNGRDLFGKETQVELRIALLDHATQKARTVDPAGRPIDGRAITAHPLLVTRHALALRDQPLAQREVGPLEHSGDL